MYKLTNTQIIIRIGDNASIPNDTANRDYAEYLAWVTAGNIPTSADQLQATVATCSPWQIRKMLNQLGLRASVEDAVSVSTDQAIKDGWEYASEFRSDDPFVISMGAALGKTGAETFALIKAAADA